MTADPVAFPAAVDAALDELAAAEVLLVASDFDGTLSPLVDDPSAATPLPAAVAAIDALAGLVDTHVALVSGRALADLQRIAARDGFASTIELIGSHGWESEAWTALQLSDDEARRHALVVDAAERVGTLDADVLVEVKPATVAIHYRLVDAGARDEIEAAILAGPAAVDGVSAMRGKDVVEVAVVETTKGTALRRLAGLRAATVTAFFGDDATDEHAFAQLSTGDFGVKVGPGATLAGLRVDDPAAVAAVLTELATRRAAAPR